jgi:hypothetical protein
MDLKSIILSEISQPQKEKHCRFYLMWNLGPQIQTDKQKDMNLNKGIFEGGR